MATIKDVAERAGVSIATVSRILNNAENVGTPYRKAVEAAIEELNFQPNMAARSLKNRPYHIIGVIMSDFSTPFFEKIIKRIEKTFRADGDLVLFVNTYDDAEIERQGIEFMLERQADVIVISPTGANEEYLAKVRHAGVSVIFVDRRPVKEEFPAVYVDKKSGTKDILRHLEQNGHDRIAVVTGPRQLTTNYDRYTGVMEYLYERGRDPQDTAFYYGAFTEEFGYETAAKLLTAATPPTAIIAGSAVIAAGIMLYCREHGIRIPEDLSLVSFGDFGTGRLIEPRLTYVTDEHARIGELLETRIKEAFAGTLQAKADLVIPRLIENESVGRAE